MSRLGRNLSIFIALATSTLVLTGAAPDASAAPGPAEFLPVRHAAYEELEALAARGLLDSLQIYTRPLARVDVARLPADVELLELARSTAIALLGADPGLDDPEHAVLKWVLDRRFGTLDAEPIAA